MKKVPSYFAVMWGRFKVIKATPRALLKSLATYGVLLPSYVLGAYLFPAITHQGKDFWRGFWLTLGDMFDGEMFNFDNVATVCVFSLLVLLADFFTPGKMKIVFLAMFAVLDGGYNYAMFFSDTYYDNHIENPLNGFFAFWPEPLGDVFAVALYFFFMGLPMTLLVLLKLFLTRVTVDSGASKNGSRAYKARDDIGVS